MLIAELYVCVSVCVCVCTSISFCNFEAHNIAQTKYFNSTIMIKYIRNKEHNFLRIKYKWERKSNTLQEIEISI